MLGLFPRRRPHSALNSQRRFRPLLESLEARNCPTAPAITNFTVTPEAGTHVVLSGQVTANGPGPITITFSGVASGSVSVSGSGSFSDGVNATSQGTVRAVAQNSQGETSNTAQGWVSVPPPHFTSFTAVNSIGNVWTFSGTVSDLENPSGLVVHLGGLRYLNATATCDSNGNFSVTLTLPYGTTGTATADVTDWWGQSAVQAEDYVG